MKRIVGSPLKLLALLTILFGVFLMVLSLWFVSLGLIIMAVGGLLYGVDALVSKHKHNRKWYQTSQYTLSVAYLFCCFLLIMEWYKRNRIVFPDHFKGEAGIVFGIEGYPPLPATKLWVKKIVLPGNGILITSTREEELHNTYRFERKNGQSISYTDLEMSIPTEYPCLKDGKAIKYIGYNFGKDSSFTLQKRLAALANRINEGNDKTLYTSSRQYVVSDVSKPYLHLQDQGLAYLPEAAGDLRVKEAILTNNMFTAIPAPILRIQGLKSLLIGFNPITDLSEDIYQLKGLKRLVLNSTRIRNITTDLSLMDSLRDLDLSTNELDSLPKQVYNIPYLTELELENNRFRSFSFVNERLRNLEVLYLHSNRVKKITTETKHLKNLKELLLFDNLIDSIPDNISDLHNLEKLEIWDNPISYISPKIAALENLRSLNLDGDRLTDAQKRQLKDWLPNCQIQIQIREKKNYF